MKNRTKMNIPLLLFALVLGLGDAFGQFLRGPASVSKPALIHLGDEGKAHPTQREKLDSSNGSAIAIVLDTLETDTGYIHFNVLGSTIYSFVDTLGVFSYTCKDSTGNDSIEVVGKWMGNPRCDGLGTWENVDSVTLVMAASASVHSGASISNVYTNKRGYVVNTGGFCRYKFHLRNRLLGNANRKATCKDAVFIERPRSGVRP